MKLAILGGGGVIGRALLEIVAVSEAGVLVTTRATVAPPGFRGRWIVASTATAQAAALEQDAPWDVVIDLRALGPGDLTGLAERAAQLTRRWIHVSSSYVYRRLREAHDTAEDQPFLPVPVPETWPLAPSGSYGEGKRACEAIWQAVHRQHRAPVVVLRVPFVFGRYDRSRRVGDYLDRLATGAPLEVPALGAARIDLIHSDDLAHAILRIGDVAPPGEILNVVLRPARPLRDHLEALAAAAGATLRCVAPRRNSEPPPFAFARDIALDGRRLDQMVGELPVTPLAVAWTSAVSWERELRATVAPCWRSS